MSELPQPQSPLVQCRLRSRHQDGSQAGVILSETAFQTHLNLRGAPGDDLFLSLVSDATGLAVPLVPNTVSRKQDLLMAWLSPDEWLLIASPASGVALRARLDETLSGSHYALNDLSGGQMIIGVSGPRAIDVLAKGCTLDLHPRVFGPSQCAQSHLAKSAALIIPRVSNLCAYDVIVRRSFSEYLWRWLARAAEEYGVHLA